jgi:rhodanese-related sulfurtransferase/anti-anti-sigma regulatory factor
LRQIKAAAVKTLLDRGDAVLIDVREPDEHARERIEGACLAPLSRFDPVSLVGEGEREKIAVFHCNSENRTVQAADQLLRAGFAEAYQLEGGIQGWKRAARKAPLPIMRQVQIVAGSLVLLGIVLAVLVSPWFMALSAFVGAGLIFAGITGFHLPTATLAATIIVAVLALVDLGAIRRTFAYSKSDFTAMAATILVVLGVGIEAGIVTGIAVSILLYLWRTSRPHMAIVGQVPGTEHFRNVLRHEVITSERVLTMRVDESLYFANTRYLENRIHDLVAARPKLEHVVLMCPAVNFIDASALESLEAIVLRLQAVGVTFHLSEVKGPVMDRLQPLVFPRAPHRRGLSEPVPRHGAARSGDHLPRRPGGAPGCASRHQSRLSTCNRGSARGSDRSRLAGAHRPPAVAEAKTAATGSAFSRQHPPRFVWFVSH